jgi:hypothetical protein
MPAEGLHNNGMQDDRRNQKVVPSESRARREEIADHFANLHREGLTPPGTGLVGFAHILGIAARERQSAPVHEVDAIEAAVRNGIFPQIALTDIGNRVFRAAQLKLLESIHESAATQLDPHRYLGSIAKESISELRRLTADGTTKMVTLAPEFVVDARRILELFDQGRITQDSVFSALGDPLEYRLFLLEHGTR